MIKRNKFLLAGFATIVVLSGLLAVMTREPSDYMHGTPDGRLIVEGRTVTLIKVQGVRCVLATETTTTALACDFSYAGP